MTSLTGQGGLLKTGQGGSLNQGGLLKSGLLNRVFNRQNQPDGAFPITHAARSNFVPTGSDQQPSPRANAKWLSCMRSCFNPLAGVFKLKQTSLQTLRTNPTSSDESNASTRSHIQSIASIKHSIIAGSAVNVDDDNSALSDQSAKKSLFRLPVHLRTVMFNSEKSVIVSELSSTYSRSSSSSLGHQLGDTDTDSAQGVYLSPEVFLESCPQQSSETSQQSFSQQVASKKQRDASNNFISNHIVDDYQDVYGESYSQFSSMKTHPSFKTDMDSANQSSKSNDHTESSVANKGLNFDDVWKAADVNEETTRLSRLNGYCAEPKNNPIDVDKALYVYWDDALAWQNQTPENFDALVAKDFNSWFGGKLPTELSPAIKAAPSDSSSRGEIETAGALKQQTYERVEV